MIIGCHTTYDTEFKNSIFYQELRPFSRHSGYQYLTPTSIDFRTPLDKNKIDGTGKCDLIENQQDRITLKCEGNWDNGDEFHFYLTYVIEELHTHDCLRIVEYAYDNPERLPKNKLSESSFCTTPPADMKLEID